MESWFQGEGDHRVRRLGITSSPAFLPQGERGVKGACGLDGEKGDKVQRGWGMGGYGAWGLRLTPLPDACREKLVPQAALGWQDTKERW